MVLNILLFAAMNEADKKRRKLLANKNRASQYLVAKPLNQTAVKNGNNKKESRESKKIRDSNTTTLMLIVVITVRQFRDRREYRYRIENTDTKDCGISIGLDWGISWVSVSVSVSIRDIFESRYQYQSRLRPLDHILFDMKGFLIK